jgi:hypothetical protein
LAHPSHGNCRKGRPVTAQKRTLALSRSLSARARSHIAELDQEIERLQRSEEATVVATGAPRERGCPAWVVLGVKALEMGGVRAA